MKVYTSYYQKFAHNPQGLIPVRVSTSIPQWFPYICEELPELYPGWELVNGIKGGTLTHEEYERRYKERLSGMVRQEIILKLIQISKQNGGRDVVLLCYERPEDFCHRHFIAEWLNIGVKEVE